MVVAGLDSFNQRIEESVKFMDWGFRAWQSQPLVRQGQQDRRRRRSSSAIASRSAWSRRATSRSRCPAASPANIRVKVVYDGPIKAPIAAGQHIADLVVTTADTPPQTMPLVADKAVGEAGFFGRIWAGLTLAVRLS